MRVADRVLVISVDGLAPRAITPVTMPNLCALARSGAGCFTATTVVPSLTVPAHASMLRGVGPATHGLVDNTPLTPDAAAASFLGAGRRAGRTTAAVVCWTPLDHLLEPDAVDHRRVWAAGYDAADDLDVVGHVVDLMATVAPDVTFAYMVATDLAGHAHGWDSEEYVSAARSVDVRLGELFAAAGDETAIVVTTDHGGVGHHHAEPSPATLTTFVAVRSRRLAAGSCWPGASILDIAPTVVDLCGIIPDPSWEGATLIGRELPLLEHLLLMLRSMSAHAYGDRVDMLAHSLQTAACLAESGASEALVAAGLLHDVGHVLGDAGQWGVPDHAELGARFLQQWLPPAVVEPIRLHVDAKRYLVATDPGYAGLLSDASIATLTQQGGAMSAAEATRFECEPFFADALTLRRCDDEGKRRAPQPRSKVAPDDEVLDSYRPLLAAVLA